MSRKKKEQIPKINPKEDLRNSNKNLFCRAWRRMVYLPNGEFSMTRIVMILMIGQAFLTWLIAIILSIFTKIKIPAEIFDYSIKLSGAGIGQYALTKAKDSFDFKTSVKEKEVDKNIPKV